MKIEITKKQAEQFNNMRAALRAISTGYQTPSQIKKNCEKDYGLEFDEAIEMSYENIQECAKRAAKCVSALSIF